MVVGWLPTQFVTVPNKALCLRRDSACSSPSSAPNFLPVRTTMPAVLPVRTTMPATLESLEPYSAAVQRCTGETVWQTQPSSEVGADLSLQGFYCRHCYLIHQQRPEDPGQDAMLVQPHLEPAG